MMNRTIGSSDQPTTIPTTGISTSASGSTGTTVMSVTTESVVSSQPMVSSSQPVVPSSQPVVSSSQPMASTVSESEEVRSKVPEDTSGSKDDQPVSMATEPPAEGSNSSDDKVVPSTAPAPAEEQRRPRLTIRLVHRPRGAPRCKYCIFLS